MTEPESRDEPETRDVKVRPHPAPQPGECWLRHVLVCLDRSPLAEEGVPHALAIARPWGARITLLHVLEPPHESQNLRTPSTALDWEITRAEASHYLEAIRDRLSASGADVDVRVEQGQAAEQVLRLAEENGVDLTVISSHGEGGATEWGLSSTAEKIGRRIRGSILVVPSGRRRAEESGEPAFGTILVPLDGSQRAECVLPAVERLARQYSSEVVLFHVVPTPCVVRPTQRTAEDRRLAAVVQERNELAASQYVRQLQQQLAAAGVNARTIVSREPDVKAAIRQAAQREGADLLVLSAHGHTGSTAYLYGSATEHLMARMEVPLLVIQDLPRHELSRIEGLSRSRELPMRSARLVPQRRP